MGRKVRSGKVRHFESMRNYEHNPIYILCGCGKRGFDTEQEALDAGSLLKKSRNARSRSKSNIVRAYECMTKYHYTTTPLNQYEKNKRIYGRISQ